MNSGFNIMRKRLMSDSGTNKCKSTKNCYVNICKEYIICDKKCSEEKFKSKFYNDTEPEDDVCTDRACHCYKSKILNINVATDLKAGHPWENRIKNDMCYVVDGVKGKTISLVRGYTYIFNITDPKHSFYFTSDPLGGSRIKPIILPNDAYSGNTISLYVSKVLPTAFFYQSTSDTAMGGIVVIEEPVYCCEEKKEDKCFNFLNDANDSKDSTRIV